MADATDGDRATLPPPREEVHLPDPSYLPFLVAFGITLAVLGIVLNIGMVVIGVAIALWCLVKWIRHTREEMSELPLEH